MVLDKENGKYKIVFDSLEELKSMNSDLLLANKFLSSPNMDENKELQLHAIHSVSTLLLTSDEFFS